MSRRMDREGVMRSHTQYIKNMRTWNDPRCKEDERGWVQPFANWQGWDEYNHAVYALQCVALWRRIKSEGAPDCARIESDLRSFSFHIAKSHGCDRPQLP